jgi:bifunctional UDP-N-acetylglucosamine pyrophosphorylase/glucosamine-1-phosphate N-acetyltransferase
MRSRKEGQDMTAVDVVIMAAGKGTRMKSQRPKVLHRLAGRALVDHVADCAAALQARRIVLVTGHGADEVEAAVKASATAPPAGTQPAFVRQEPQLGTGHAVQQAVPVLPDDGVALILNGDVPLIQPATLRELLDACGGERLALLSVSHARPHRLRPHRARGRARHRASSSTRTPARRSAASARSTPASWRCPTRCSSAGWRA